MRYWPESFVLTDRTFSMSAGLEASTLTPGSTAPDGSRTMPVIDACAYTSEGMMRKSPREAHAVFSRCIRPPHVAWLYACAHDSACPAGSGASAGGNPPAEWNNHGDAKEDRHAERHRGSADRRE